MVQSNTPKRFYKPVCYIDKPRKPLKCLKDIYMLFEPPDIRKEITLWQQRAICSEGNVYDEGRAREDLIEYAASLIKLCEAFYLIYTSSAKAKKEQRKLKLSKKLQKQMAKRQRPKTLTKKEMKSPHSVINNFCLQFSKNYAATELSDMIDAVITYKGNKEFFKGNIILLYRCLKSLLIMARAVHHDPAIIDKIRSDTKVKT